MKPVALSVFLRMRRGPRGDFCRMNGGGKDERRTDIVTNQIMNERIMNHYYFGQRKNE